MGGDGKVLFKHAMADECRLSPEWYVTVAALRTAPEKCCKENAEREPLNRRQFAAALSELGCRPGKRQAGRVWEGIGLVGRESSVPLLTAEQVVSPSI